MDPDVEKLLFAAATGFSRPEERKLFLDHVCKDDARGRRDLEDLLRLNDAAESFFDLQPEVRAEGGRSEDEGLGASIGRYRLIERIGAGGCGVVYLAEQQEPVRRKVALKVIRVGMDTEHVIARFNAERQALAMMDHPNIARVFDAGATAAGRPYFVMELVDGERITDFCGAGLELPERLRLFVQVCQAIQHAHQKGVIHRDIKPSNVLVHRHDGAMVPKVIDFGIAKATTGGPGEDATFTKLDQMIGTPAYMSPEQAAGGTDVDTRSDVYSLGVLLYELVTGRPPFAAKRLTEAGMEETRRILRDEEPPLPSLVVENSGLGDLDWVIMKAMAKERTRRYDTANGLAIDVLRYLDDEPVSARAPTRRYWLGKLIRRNKMVFAAGCAAAICLLAGFGVSTVLFLREKRALDELSRQHRIAEEARVNEQFLREAAEYRESVAHAAVQIGRGNLEEADRLLASVPVDRTPVSLEAADCYRRLAEWHVLAKRYDRAADRYSSSVHAFANVDDADSNHISFDLLPATSALCYAGNEAGYEKIREFAIQRFSGTRHPQVAEQVLKASLLKPAPASLLRKLDEMVALAEISVNDPNGWVIHDQRLSAWFCFAIGLKAFREGDDERASVWMSRCLNFPDVNEARVASVRCITAMIESHRANRTGARALVGLAQEPIETVLEGELPLIGPNGLWLDWLNAAQFLDEARRTLGP
ncbi:serine/threonine-protein kinase [Luteolibacter sp. LG18]|uniref:serine/threonine protein kinase n=1 Tax=Luteolibacter sp. LG18 TaxID=2819286 RepID=UPI002B29FD8C|nr:hypothetical protein llg_40710 [Luteolibacter sp. LG18]